MLAHHNEDIEFLGERERSDQEHDRSPEKNYPHPRAIDGKTAQEKKENKRSEEEKEKKARCFRTERRRECRYFKLLFGENRGKKGGKRISQKVTWEKGTFCLARKEGVSVGGKTR